MRKYIAKRLLLMIPVILGVVILVFTLLYLAPGDAVSVILGSGYTEEAAAVMREELGLNEPYIVQLGNYLVQLAHLDFGKSWVSGVPVAQELMARAPRTLIIGSVSILITAVCGILLGIVAAINQNKWPDTVATVLALLGTSLPNFFFALLLVLVFAYYLDWLPAYGMGGIEYYILPVIANAVGGIAMLTRQTRSSMLEVIRADYITMARSKGLSNRKIIFQHMLPNAMIPVLTTIGMQFAGVLGGGIIIETVFSIPGVGYYLVTGCNNRDYNVVMACTIVISVAFSIIMLAVDLLMAAVDPRIKAQFAESGARKRGKKHA
ncbi:MAG: ABC transporter permease [Candidatus Onthomonas sp.]